MARPRRRKSKCEFSEPNRLVADVNAPLVQQVLDIPEREGRTGVQHRGQADDLGALLEIAEREGLKRQQG
jgi:hypothetical protein